MPVEWSPKGLIYSRIRVDVPETTTLQWFFKNILLFRPTTLIESQVIVKTICRSFPIFPHVRFSNDNTGLAMLFL
jgi:hypothetical protein